MILPMMPTCGMYKVQLMGELKTVCWAEAVQANVHIDGNSIPPGPVGDCRKGRRCVVGIRLSSHDDQDTLFLMSN